MANRSRSDDRTDGDAASPEGETDGGTVERESDPGSGYRLPPAQVESLRDLADRIDALAETLPLDAARHHARKAAEAARQTADNDARLVVRRAAVGELVTELRSAADEADSTRTQYQLLEILYEQALPATREASPIIYR